MNQEELAQWFDANKTLLETAYLTGQHPWQQSGVGLHTPILPRNNQEKYVRWAKDYEL